MGVAESTSPPAVVAADGANTVADCSADAVVAAMGTVWVTVTGASVRTTCCGLWAAPAQAASVRLRQGINRRQFILSPSSMSSESVFPLADHGENLYGIGEGFTGVHRRSF